MSHTKSEKDKLLARVRRVRGQIEALERAIDDEKGCATVLHLIVAARGAMNSLMTEVIEDHIRLHIVDPAKDAERSRGAEELIEAVQLSKRTRRGTPCRPPATVTSFSAKATGGTRPHLDGDRARTVMMVAEIVGGLLFGSIALVADGLDMSTHPARCCSPRSPSAMRGATGRGAALLLRHRQAGDLAGFSTHPSVDDRALDRLRGVFASSRRAIHFNEAIPIAALGLMVNVVSVLLLAVAATITVTATITTPTTP